MKKILQISILVVLFITYLMIGLSYADTHTADSCSLTHVQAAVDAASRGDTVAVPACAETTWNDELDITKAIKLQGAGIDTTNIKSGMTGGTGYTTSKFLIRYIPSSPSADENELIEITGFTFNEDLKSGSILIRNDGTTNTYPLRKVRIHHNKIINSFGTESTSAEYATSITIEGMVYGVIDNNTITGMMRVGNYGANYGNSGTSAWNYSTFSYGSPDNMYWEDNTFTKNVSTDTRRSLYVYHDRGGRSVFRYNDFINSLDNDSYNGEGIYVIDTHGTLIGGTYPTATYRNRSTMGAEFYGNYINTTGTDVQVWGHRGGRFLSFWNYINLGTKSAVSIIQDEANEYYASTNHVCTGSSFTDSEGTHTNYSSCDSTGVKQEQKRSYYFNNRKSTGSLLNTQKVSASTQWGGNQITLNTEDASGYNQSDNCTATSCSSGVGCGSATPTGTCVTGTGYFKTDLACGSLSSDNYGANPTTPISGTLYRCGPTNVWSVYYVPYTYPHPLRSEADTTAPDISKPCAGSGTCTYPIIEIPCDDEDLTEDIVIGLTATDQQASITCKADLDDVAYASMSDVSFTQSGTAQTATVAGLACAQQHTYYARCTDGTTANSSSLVIQFTIAEKDDEAAAAITSVTATNQACAVQQRIQIATDKPSTCKWSLTDEAYADMDYTFSVTGGETGHIAHSTDVTQNCSQSVTRYIRCSTTQGVANSSSTAVTITTDSGKTVAIGSGGLTLGIGSGGQSVNIIP